MKEDAYQLDSHRRAIVLKAIQHVCARRNWTLLAAHVRTTHVHVVASFDGSAPDEVMNALKCEASRLLNETGIDRQSPAAVDETRKHCSPTERC